MLDLLPQALSHLGAATTIAKSLLGLHDAALISGKVIELTSSIISAQQQVLAAQSETALLSSRIKDLETECARLKDWTDQRNRYTRRQVGDGVFAYVEDLFEGNFEAAHKPCCNCFDKAVQSTLQQSRDPERMRGLVCPNGCPKVVFTHYL